MFSKILLDTKQLFLKYKKELFLYSVAAFLPLTSLALLLSPDTSGTTPPPVSAETGVIMALIALAKLLVGVFSAVIIVLLAQACKDGQELSFKTALDNGFKIFPRTLATMVTGGFLLVLLFLLLVVPGVFFTVLWLFMLQAAVLRGKVAVEAMTYSKSLVQGRWWKTFGYYMLIVLSFMLLTIIIQVPGALLGAGLKFLSVPLFIIKPLSAIWDALTEFTQLFYAAALTFMFFQWEESKP